MVGQFAGVTLASCSWASCRQLWKECFFLQIQLAYLFLSLGRSLFHHFSSVIFLLCPKRRDRNNNLHGKIWFLCKSVFQSLATSIQRPTKNCFKKKQIRFLNKNTRESHSFQSISLLQHGSRPSICSRYRCYLFERSAQNWATCGVCNCGCVLFKCRFNFTTQLDFFLDATCDAIAIFVSSNAINTLTHAHTQ